jgi:hypothetical protein
MSKKRKAFPINSLVRIKEELAKEYSHVTNEGDCWIYLGDIAQMPGHGIFLLHAGPDQHKFLTGFHTDSFRLLTEDEV